MRDRTRVAWACVTVFALNAIICFPLFHTEYLDEPQSVEGTFMTFGKFLAENWPHTGWFPWFNAGMGFEYTYLPLTSMLVAGFIRIGHVSPGLALHLIAALSYSLAPVFLFVFVREASGRFAPALWSAMLWTLFSPSALVPVVRHDMGAFFGSRRLMNIVFYGEEPHNLALCLLPVALLLIARNRRFAGIVIATAAVMATNAFGIVVIAISGLMLLVSRKEIRVRDMLRWGAALIAAYLLICRALPPSLVQLIRTNSQFAGGNYRFTLQSNLSGVLFAVALAGIWFVTRRRLDPMWRFAILFSACWGGIALLSYSSGIGFIPQPERYHLEMEIGFSLLSGLAIDAAMRRFRRRAALTALFAIALGALAVLNYQYARRIIHPIAAEQMPVYQQAQWLTANLPEQRVMVASDYQGVFNLFSPNPQLSAGHETTAPNGMQRVAVYTIYTGENAGDQDGAISMFWLKVYGTGAIVVPGSNAREYYHPVRNPRKFDGLIPEVWRQGEYAIYRVPLRSNSLAHVVPLSAVVTRPPEHGLDIDPVRAYAAALDDPALPEAPLQWINPDHGRIATTMGPSQVVSVQMTYDRGWTASAGDHPAPVKRDALGMIVIEPECSGACTIDLEFTGGWERRVCSGVSLLTAAVLAGMLIRSNRQRPRVQ
jgi:hypothetical protein